MTHTATASNGASRLSRIAPGLASLLHYRFGEDRQRIGPGSARDVALARANLGTFRVGRQDLRAVQQQQVQVQSARMAMLRAQSEQLIQRVNLHLALGGSFAAPMKVAATQP